MEATASQTKSPFSTEPVGRLIAKFAIPCVISLLVNSLYNIVDQIFIGWGVGYLGNGATNVVFPITIVALSLSLMIGNGGAAYLSLKLGEGDVESARRGVGNAIALVTIVSILLTAVFLLFIDPILTLFGATDVLRPYALQYGFIIGLGLPFMMISAAINSMIRADGSPKYAMLSMVIGAIINVILDPVLIFGVGPIPAMGVIGAALATAGAQGVVTLLFIVLAKKQGHFFVGIPVLKKPDWEHIRAIWKLGLPVGIQNVFMSGLSLIISSMVAGWGPAAVAVQKVGGQVESISWMISGGFSMAVNSFIGQNYGAGKMQRVKKGYNTALILMMAWGFLCTLVLVVFPEFIFQIFIREEEVLPLGVSYLRILGVCQMFVCMEGCSTGVFNGLGETRVPSVVSVVFNLMRIPLALLLSATPLGLDGIWWALTISAICKGLVLTVWYLVYVWKKRLYHTGEQEVEAVQP